MGGNSFGNVGIVHVHGRGVADGVVLVFVMRLIRTDRVVARPLAIAQTFAQWKCSFVKSGSDRHLKLFLAADERG